MSEIAITRLSSKGQVVIPKSLREILGFNPGEIFAMFGEGDTIVLKKISLPSDSEFEELLKWGSDFAKKKGITRKDVIKAIEEVRSTGS